MDGRSPNQVFAAELKKKRVLTPALLEELALERTAPTKVGRNGVRWQYLFYGRNHPELVKREGRQVILGVDHANTALVRVYDPDGRWVCNVTANEKLPVLGADKQAIRDVKRAERRDKKARRAYEEARPRMTMSLTDRLYQRAEEKRREAPPAPPPGGPSLVPVRHPVEDQLPAIRRALDAGALRPAVGAEALGRDVLRAAIDGAARRQEADVEIDAFSILSGAVASRQEDGNAI
jgi:hypothetical protein